jgi:hypothetical protein
MSQNKEKAGFIASTYNIENSELRLTPTVVWWILD